MSASLVAINMSSGALDSARRSPPISISGSSLASFGAASSICASAVRAARRMSSGFTGAAGERGASVAPRMEAASAISGSLAF